jgi:uncharacterized OsmC-like protein
MVDVTVFYEGALRCKATHRDSGTIVVTDGPKDYYGHGASFSPSDLLSVSLGGCILSVMGIAAQASGLDITGSTATIKKEMAGAPRRIARMEILLDVACGNLSQEQKHKLEEAAHSCPVHHVLGIEVPITIKWE